MRYALRAMRSGRFTVLIAALGLLFAVAALWGANKQILGLFHDDGIYTVVAKSLYQGDGYRIISLPAAPAQTKYPFLYSYLLSWLWVLNPSFPENILVLKAFNIAALVAIFFVAVALYRRIFSVAQTGALLFAVLVCANPVVFTYTDYVVSDLLLVLFALAALLISRARADRGASAAQGPLLTVISGLACLNRLAAAPLAFAGAVQLFLSHGWRSAIYFIVGVTLLVTPWFLWVLSNQEASVPALLRYYSAYDFSGTSAATFGGWLAGRASVITSNARYLLGSFDLIYLLPLMPWLTPFVAVFTGIGMAVSRSREDAFAWCLFLSSLALLLVWPFHPGRYAAPLVPLLILFLFRGMAAAERWIQSARAEYPFKQAVAKLAWAPAALVLLLNGVWLSSYFLINDEQTTRGLYGRRVPYGWNGFEESFAWIRQNTAADALVATAYDPMYFLYTGRRAIRPALHRSATYFYPYGRAEPDVGTIDEIKPELERMGIEYLIVDPLDGYAEGKATIELVDKIVASYGDRAHAFLPALMASIAFMRSDGSSSAGSLNNFRSPSTWFGALSLSKGRTERI